MDAGFEPSEWVCRESFHELEARPKHPAQTLSESMQDYRQIPLPE